MDGKEGNKVLLASYSFYQQNYCIPKVRIHFFWVKDFMQSSDKAHDTYFLLGKWRKVEIIIRFGLLISFWTNALSEVSKWTKVFVNFAWMLVTTIFRANEIKWISDEQLSEDLYEKKLKIQVCKTMPSKRKFLPYLMEYIHQRKRNLLMDKIEL